MKDKPAGSQVGLFELVLALAVIWFFSGNITFTHTPAAAGVTRESTASSAQPDFWNAVDNAESEPIPTVNAKQLEPISDLAWKNRPGLINNSAWATILDAASQENSCDARFMYWTWISESGELDCEYWLTQPGPNQCISRAGARGPMQFMGAWNEAGISDPGWSIGNLHDSIRAACRMWTKMDLWSHTYERESFALRFSSEDVYRAGRIPRVWEDRAWNVGKDGYNQALSIWDNVNSIP